MNNLFLSLFSLFFPSQCINCGIEISFKEKLVCYGCMSKIKWTNHLENEIRSQIIQLINVPNVIDANGFFVFEKEGVEQNLIHRLKYEHSKKTGFILGRQFGQKVKKKIQDSSIEFLIPVPTHYRKKFDRGYNQSETIARGLSKELNIPASSKLVAKIKNTTSQTKLNKEERTKNIQGSFICAAQFRNINSIGIVDDVITSGSTITELCRSIVEINCSIRITIFVLGVVRHD